MISVVIAAFNESATIADVVRGVLAALPDPHEVLVVDDGSTDETALVAREAGARVVTLPVNRGKGEALRTGIGEAVGDLLLFIDADGQDDPSEIPRLLEGLDGDTAMVIGSRFRGRLLDGAITVVNRAGNQFLTFAFNVLHGSHLTDTQAGFRLVRRDALDLPRLRARRYEIETELTLHVLRRGGQVKEVPVTRSRRDHGASGFFRPYDGLRILWCMIIGRFEP